MSLSTIAFDADDTLWSNEHIFHLTEERFRNLLSSHVDISDLSDHLLETERRNLGYYGYGIKGFTLSMIETAIEVTGGQIPASDLQEIIHAGRDMQDHPTAPFPHVEDVLKSLQGKYRLLVITKGDLFDQERKIAQSGLGDYFDGVEIVSEKTAETYKTIFTAYGDGPERSMMIGNSLKSDIHPALDAGAYGVHIPHDFNWAMEYAEEPESSDRFYQLKSITELPELIKTLT